MKSLCIVFTVPSRFFDDMVEACMQLDNYYQIAPVRPLYIATMKRPYYFENSKGEYGEFESGNRFLIFEGQQQYLNTASLFQGIFPSPALLKEVEWEGIHFHNRVIAIDSELSQKLSDMHIKINTYCENDWMTIEDYSSYLSPSRESRVY